MDVLLFIFQGLLTIAILVCLQWLNKYTWKKYSFKIFHKSSFGVSIVGYIFVYLGYISYENALKTSGDLLNGMVIIFIGIGLILYVVNQNIQRSSLFIGLVLSLLQGAVYIFVGYIGIYYLIMMIIIASQIRPVYVVNS